MKKLLTGISLVAVMVLGANAQNFKTKQEEGVCRRVSNIINEVREDQYCSVSNSPAQMALLNGHINGQARFFQERYGNFSTSVQKMAGGTGIQINTDWKTWLWNYRTFLCSLDRADMQNLDIFLTFRTTNEYRKLKVDRFRKRYASFLSVNDTRVKGNMIEPIYVLNHIFFGFQYQPDQEIKDFVGYIAAGNYKVAKELIYKSKRTQIGYDNIRIFCSYPTEK